MHRLEQLQRNLSVFKRNEAGDVQTDATAANAFSKLEASKLEVLKLIRRDDDDSQIPEPPDLNVLL